MHNQLAERSIRWIRSRSSSMRGALEVWLGNGYVADAVVVGGLQNRFHQQYARHWGKQPMRVYPVMNQKHVERKIREDGDLLCSYVHVFEVKATRSDFLSTFGPNAKQSHRNRLDPVGTTHWVVADRGVCEPEEIPAFWGLLVRSGGGLREIKMPGYGVYDEGAFHRISHTLLWKDSLYRSGISAYDG